MGGSQAVGLLSALEYLHQHIGITDGIQRFDRVRQEFDNEMIVNLIVDIQWLSKAKITEYVEGEVVRPGAHIRAFRPFALLNFCPKVIAPVSNMVYNLRLHVPKRTLRKSTRKQSPFPRMLLWTDCCECTRLPFLGMLNGPIPVRFDDIGFSRSVDILQGRCRTD